MAKEFGREGCFLKRPHDYVQSITRTVRLYIPIDVSQERRWGWGEVEGGNGGGEVRISITSDINSGASAGQIWLLSWSWATGPFLLSSPLPFHVLRACRTRAPPTSRQSTAGDWTAKIYGSGVVMKRVTAASQRPLGRLVHSTWLTQVYSVFLFAQLRVLVFHTRSPWVNVRWFARSPASHGIPTFPRSASRCMVAAVLCLG